MFGPFLVFGYAPIVCSGCCSLARARMARSVHAGVRAVVPPWATAEYHANEKLARAPGRARQRDLQRFVPSIILDRNSQVWLHKSMEPGPLYQNQLCTGLCTVCGLIIFVSGHDA